MDRKLLKNVILGYLLLGNGLLGMKIPEEETETISQEEQVKRALTDELFRAIALGDATSLKNCLEKGADSNQVAICIDLESGKIRHSTTPLICAVASSNTGIAQ
jgi:hypothetical protein